jgi:hypothetical protein
LAFSLILDEVLLLALTLHAAGVGAAAGAPLLRALPGPADNIFMRALFALALGLAIDIALVFALGLCGFLGLGSLLTVGAASALIALARLVESGQLGWPRIVRAEFIVMALLYIWVAASAIKAPGYFDDTMYHLPLARFYLETHGLGLDPFERFPLFPQNMEMLFALGLALRPHDVLVAEGLAALPAFVVTLGLVGAGRWLRDSWWLGVIAAAIFLGLPDVERTLGYAYVDAGLAMFCFAAGLGIVLVRRSAPTGAYMALGLLAGVAIGCKLHGLVWGAIALVALLAFRARLSALFAFALTAALFGCGWYVRSFWISGDPLSPAGGPWFGYFLWDAADLAGQRAELATHGIGTALWKFPLALIKAGANWTPPGLLAPLIVRRERAVAFALWAMFVAYALFWFYTSQVDRYLAPALGFGSLLSAWFLYDAVNLLSGWLAPRLRDGLRKPWVAFGFAVVLLAGYVIPGLARAGMEIADWDRILATRPGYLAMQAANAREPGARLVQVGFESARYFYDGVVIGDWFGAGRYRPMFGPEGGGRLVPAVEMRSVLDRFGAKLLVLNLHMVKFDEPDYRRYFDFLFMDGDQALLLLKPE